MGRWTVPIQNKISMSGTFVQFGKFFIPLLLGEKWD